MDELTTVGLYFERKSAAWVLVDGTVVAHLRRVGKAGLVEEFRLDPDFDVVRRYLRRVAKVLYVQDIRYSDFTKKVRESVVRESGGVRGVTRQVNPIVRAAMIASGVWPFGDRLVRVVGGLPR